jgi:hypothetical protein
VTVRRPALVALALLLAAACGGKGDGDPGVISTAPPSLPGTTPSATATTSPSAGATASGGASTRPGTPGTSPGGSTAPGSSATASPPASQPPGGSPTGPPPTDNAKLIAKLTRSCVTPGGVQTLSLDTHPDMFVVFDTQYADGKDGQVYGGIETNGRSDSRGHYQKTWVVAPNTPLGDARVDIAVAGKYQGQNRSAVRQMTFRVARSC